MRRRQLAPARRAPTERRHEVAGRWLGRLNLTSDATRPRCTTCFALARIDNVTSKNTKFVVLIAALHIQAIRVIARLRPCSSAFPPCTRAAVLAATNRSLTTDHAPPAGTEAPWPRGAKQRVATAEGAKQAPAWRALAKGAAAKMEDPLQAAVMRLPTRPTARPRATTRARPTPPSRAGTAETRHRSATGTSWRPSNPR